MREKHPPLRHDKAPLYDLYQLYDAARLQTELGNRHFSWIYLAHKAHDKRGMTEYDARTEIPSTTSVTSLIITQVTA